MSLQDSSKKTELGNDRSYRPRKCAKGKQIFDYGGNCGGRGNLQSEQKGPSIKYVMLEGGGVRGGVTVCDRGRRCDVTLLKHFSYI